MQYATLIFGIVGFSLALGAYSRLDKLEKMLKEKGILAEDWKSE
jgi:hypothetical protein